MKVKDVNKVKTYMIWLLAKLLFFIVVFVGAWIQAGWIVALYLFILTVSIELLAFRLSMIVKMIAILKIKGEMK